MIKRLMKELLSSEVTDKYIAKNWKTIGYIGSYMQEDVECNVTYHPYYEGSLWIDWVMNPKLAEVMVRFSIKAKRINYLINGCYVDHKELNEENTGNAIVWMFKTNRALNI